MATQGIKRKSVEAEAGDSAPPTAEFKKPAVAAAGRSASSLVAGCPVSDVQQARDAPALAKMEVAMTVLSAASGRQLAAFRAGIDWTGAAVKEVLASHLESGLQVCTLLSGLQPLHDAQTVGDLGLGDCVMLHAVFQGAPTLHLLEPCSAVDLCNKHDRWNCFGLSDDEDESEDDFSSFVLKSVYHKGWDVAPQAAQEIAEELHRALGENASSEVVIISGTLGDTKEACLRALAIKKEDSRWNREGDELIRPAPKGEGFDVWSQSVVESVQWNGTNVIDFFELPEPVRQAVGHRLSGHFVFCFFGFDRSPKPRVFGGFASDGSIVGFLTSDS